MKKILSTITLILILVSLVGCGSKNEVQSTSANTTKQSDKANKKEEINKDNAYDKIQQGMTLEEVQNILGKGKEQASSKAGDIEIKNYTWNTDGELITVVFQNGKVDTKARAGKYKTSSKQLTMSMYEQLKEGMTLEEVIAILGEGKEEGSTEASGIKIKSYSWLNNNGGITCTFENGKLTTKVQVGLK